VQAVILAGGRGTRLGSLTGGRPKPLTEVAGKPFIVYLIEALRRFGFADILLLVGSFGSAYEEYLGDGARFGVRLRRVPDDPPADTAGALVHAALYLAPRFLLVNGDSFFDINLLDLVTRPITGPWLARLALREVADARRYGKAVLDGDRLTAFEEKPDAGPGLINAGIYWLKREIVPKSAVSPCSLERQLLPPLVARGLVRGTIYRGRFIDIGTPEDLALAGELLPLWERRPAAFLDRDGVLNRDTGYVSRKEDFVWNPGAKLAIRRLNDRGFFVFVVTNQAGIAKGLYSPADVERLHRWMNRELRRTGAHIDAFYYCPHHPTEGTETYRRVCACRKPAPEMLLQAMREWPVERAASFMIGDKATDMEAARAAQVTGILSRHEDLDVLVRRVLAGELPPD
jgi:D-glycero-D-manno-heptose 1,7-bisphosphate phosphatase